MHFKFVVIGKKIPLTNNYCQNYLFERQKSLKEPQATIGVITRTAIKARMWYCAPSPTANA